MLLWARLAIESVATVCISGLTRRRSCCLDRYPYVLQPAMSRFLPTEKMVLYLIRTIALEKGFGTWEHSHNLYERTTGQRGRTQDSLKNLWKKLDHNRAEIGLDPDEFVWREKKKELAAELRDLCSASSMCRHPSAADTAT